MPSDYTGSITQAQAAEMRARGEAARQRPVAVYSAAPGRPPADLLDRIAHCLTSRAQLTADERARLRSLTASGA